MIPSKKSQEHFVEDAARLRLRQVSGSWPYTLTETPVVGDIALTCVIGTQPAHPDHSSSFQIQRLPPYMVLCAENEEDPGSEPWCFETRETQGKSLETDSPANTKRHEDTECILWDLIEDDWRWLKSFRGANPPGRKIRFAAKCRQPVSGGIATSHRLEAASQRREVLVKEVLKSWPWAPRQSGAHCSNGSNCSNRHVSTC
jgi:hypothetical protein